MSYTDKSIPVLVTGGTGFLGSYLLRYLLRRGYTQVRALRRPRSRLDLLPNNVVSQVQWVEGDLLDAFSLQEALDGIKQVYHCAALVSYLPSDKDALRRINVEGTAALVNEALACGVEKFVYAGSVAAAGIPKEGFAADEHTPWEWSKALSHYALSKHSAELEVWRGAAEGLQVCVALPAVILGAGRWSEGPLKMFPLVKRGFPICPPGQNGFVDVRDAARLLIRLMESPISNERFIVSAENRSFQEVMSWVAQSLGTTRTFHPSPGWMMQAARYADALRSMLTGKPREITRDAIFHASQQIHFDNSKLLKVLGWTYTPIAQTIAEAGRIFLETTAQGLSAGVFELSGEVEITG